MILLVRLQEKFEFDHSWQWKNQALFNLSTVLSSLLFPLLPFDIQKIIANSIWIVRAGHSHFSRSDWAQEASRRTRGQEQKTTLPSLHPWGGPRQVSLWPHGASQLHASWGEGREGTAQALATSAVVLLSVHQHNYDNNIFCLPSAVKAFNNEENALGCSRCFEPKVWEPSSDRVVEWIRALDLCSSPHLLVHKSTLSQPFIEECMS